MVPLRSKAVYRNEAEIPTDHDQHKGGNGEADSPSQCFDGPVALAPVSHEEKQPAREAADGEQQQKNDNNLHGGIGHIGLGSVVD